MLSKSLTHEIRVFYSFIPKVFKAANVGKVMAKRVRASKLLAKDPNDYEARRILEEADDQVVFPVIETSRIPPQITLRRKKGFSS